MTLTTERYATFSHSTLHVNDQRVLPPNASVLEKLQSVCGSAEIWWDSSPLDFPVRRDRIIADAPDDVTKRRGGAAGLIIGGLLTEYMDWRATLYVNDQLC